MTAKQLVDKVDALRKQISELKDDMLTLLNMKECNAWEKAAEYSPRMSVKMIYEAYTQLCGELLNLIEREVTVHDAQERISF